MDINNSYTTITIWGPRKLFDIKTSPHTQNVSAPLLQMKINPN